MESAVIEFFSSNISEEEKQLIRRWIEENNPRVPQICRIGASLYNLKVIFDDDGNIVSYHAMK